MDEILGIFHEKVGLKRKKKMEKKLPLMVMKVLSLLVCAWVVGPEIAGSLVVFQSSSGLLADRVAMSPWASCPHRSGLGEPS